MGSLLIRWKQASFLFYPLALLAAVLLVYCASLKSGFVWDDSGLIAAKAPFFGDLKNIGRIITAPDAPLGAATSYYRPVNTLSYMLDYHLWGLDPLWYHLEDILLHALASILFYLVAARAFGDRTLAFFSALLFAVYPVNAEAVNFISSRNALLCGVFMMGSVLFLLKGRPAAVALSLVLYFLALLSKEQAVVLPFFLLGLSLTGFGGAAGKGNVLRALVLFFAVTAAYFVIRHLVLGVFTSEGGFPVLVKLQVMASAIFEDFKLMVFPFKLNAYYSLSQRMFSAYKALLAAAGVALLLFLSLRRGIAVPVRAGAQWVFWGLIPISNIVLISSGPVAERYLYPVLFGTTLIMGYPLTVLYRRKKAAGLAVMVLLALALGARTFARDFVWRDDLSLFQSMVRSNPQSGRVHCYLGLAYARQGRLDDAIGEFRKSVALDPRFGMARLSLGIALMNENRPQEAEGQLRDAVRLDPADAEAYSDIGSICLRTGRTDEALQAFAQAVKLNPYDAMAHNNLGVALVQADRPGDAIGQFQAALSIEPGLADAQRNLDLILKGEKKSGR
ncbi:MAG: tetratricopeptide repeat protein [Nitrospiraceae bacterium]|nr:tetratricopeptide repeat protein [Nitrospiraceae bacterium]